MCVCVGTHHMFTTKIVNVGIVVARYIHLGQKGGLILWECFSPAEISVFVKLGTVEMNGFHVWRLDILQDLISLMN